jgi:hypothetical protein
MWVRDRQMISLEQAIHKLTFHVASIWGIEGRGLLRPGFAADVTVFDPKTIKACAPEWAEDYPAATKRLIQRSEGIPRPSSTAKSFMRMAKSAARWREAYCGERLTKLAVDLLKARSRYWLVHFLCCHTKTCIELI